MKSETKEPVEKEEKLKPSIEYTIRIPSSLVKESQSGTPLDPIGQVAQKKLNKFVHQVILDLLKRAAINPPSSLVEITTTQVETQRRGDDERYFSFSKNQPRQKEAISKMIRKKVLQEGIMGVREEEETKLKGLRAADVLDSKEYQKSLTMSKKQVDKMVQEKKNKIFAERKKKEKESLPSLPPFMDPKSVVLSSKIVDRFRVKAVKNLADNAKEMFSFSSFSSLSFLSLFSPKIVDRFRVKAVKNMADNAKEMFEILKYGEWLDLPIYLSHHRMDEPTPSLEDMRRERGKRENQREEEEEEEEREGEREENKEEEEERKRGGGVSNYVPNFMSYSNSVMGMIVLPYDFNVSYFDLYLRENLSQIRKEREDLREKIAEVVNHSMELTKYVGVAGISFEVDSQSASECLYRLSKMLDLFHFFFLRSIHICIMPSHIPSGYFQTYGISSDVISPSPSSPASFASPSKSSKEEKEGGESSSSSSTSFASSDYSRVQGPTSSYELEMYALILADEWKKSIESSTSSSSSSSSSQSSENSDPQTTTQENSYLVPPVRYLLFDEITQTLRIPFDIQQKELQDFLVHKMKQYPDLLSPHHVKIVAESREKIQQILNCRSFSISGALLGQVGKQLEGMKNILVHLDDFQNEQNCYLDIVLDVEDHFDEKNRMLFINWQRGDRTGEKGMSDEEKMSE